jgi:hypothetical protein
MSIWTHLFDTRIFWICIYKINFIFIGHIGINNCQNVLKIVSMDMNIETLFKMC